VNQGDLSGKGTVFMRGNRAEEPAGQESERP
jgi:hypothetical protein